MRCGGGRIRARSGVLALALALGLVAVGGCGGGDGGAAAVPTPDTGVDAEGASDDSGSPEVAGETSRDDAVPDAPAAATCERPGTRWTPGTAVFREATAEWGLAGVHGVRFSVTDVDGDGWPDLFARQGGGPDDFTEGGARSRWLLRNVDGERFEDVTESSGVLAGRWNPDPKVGRPSQIMASGDIDNDGDLDIYVASGRTDGTDMAIEASDLMINQGDGTFELGPESSNARFASEPASPAGLSFVDFDRDGILDLWVVHNQMPGLIPMADKLLWGDGEGAFWNVTAMRGLSTRPWTQAGDINAGRGHSWGWSSNVCDLNGDGLPELLASSYGRAPNHLWRAVRGDDGEVTFVNASISSGYAFDHRVDWRDNLSAQCWCADNPADAECDTCPEPASYDICLGLKASFGDNYRWHHPSGREPRNLGGNSGQTTCADIDNDGDIDLMTGEIVHSDVGSSSDPAEILVNQGVSGVYFERPGPEATGLVREDPDGYWDHGDMTNAVFDFDNDGWADIYIGASDYPGNRGLLFHQESPLKFRRLTVEEHFEHRRSHGVVAADFDRDGDLDMVVGHSHMRCDGSLGADCYPTTEVRLFENLTADAGTSNWVQLTLEAGAGANRAAIGARVRVTAGGITQTQEVDGGHGHFGTQRDLTLHFGLGEACEAEVVVRWPDAANTEERFSVSANARYHLRAGADAVVAGP